MVDFEIGEFTCKHCGRKYTYECCRGGPSQCSPQDPRLRLMKAIEARKVKDVRGLLRGGIFRPKVDPNFRIDLGTFRRHGLTPLELAAEEGELEIVRELCSFGANVNAGLPLTHALKNDKVTVAEFLLDRGADPSQKPSDSDNALRWAAMYHRNSLVNRLLSLGAEVSSQYGSPLIAAAEQGFADTAEILLAHGASPNSYTDMDGSVLHIAVAKRDRALVKALLEHKANPNILHRGKTPLDFAEDVAIKDILKQHGGRPATAEEIEDYRRYASSSG